MYDSGRVKKYMGILGVGCKYSADIRKVAEMGKITHFDTYFIILYYQCSFFLSLVYKVLLQQHTPIQANKN